MSGECKMKAKNSANRLVAFCGLLRPIENKPGGDVREFCVLAALAGRVVAIRVGAVFVACCC